MYLCELSIGNFTSTKYCNLVLLHKMNNNTVKLECEIYTYPQSKLYIVYYCF